MAVIIMELPQPLGQMVKLAKLTSSTKVESSLLVGAYYQRKLRLRNQADTTTTVPVNKGNTQMEV